MEITWAELEAMFPDGVDFTMVPAPVATEFYHDPAEAMTGLFSVREHRTELKVIRDGLWAGMSEVSHRVFIYMNEGDVQCKCVLVLIVSRKVYMIGRGRCSVQYTRLINVKQCFDRSYMIATT